MEATSSTPDDWLRSNRAYWDERVPFIDIIDIIDIIDDEVRCLRRDYLDRGPFVEEERGSYTGPADTQANTM